MAKHDHERQDEQLDQLNRLERLDRLASLLDNSIRVPGTKWRVGIDGLIGLIPGVGDVLGALISGYIVTQAARAGASVSVLLRMGLNIVLETLVGSVPVIGDLFDFAYKANLRNVRLLRGHVVDPARARSRSRLVVALVPLLVIVIAIAILVVVLTVFRWAWTLLA